MKLSIIHLLLLFFSASAYSQFISKIVDTHNEGITYTLPKTGLIIKTTYVRKTFFHGPYAKYAKSMLHAENIFQENKTEYGIVKISITDYIQPAENINYFPEKGNINYTFIDKLKESDLIIDDPHNGPLVLNSQIIPEITQPEFFLVPFESLYKDIIDTTFRREYRDSSWLNVPYYNRKYVLKNERDHAQDAANILIGLNEKLVKSAARLDPEEGVDANVSLALIEEVNNEINKYSELFTGVAYVDTLSYSLLITPVAGKDTYNLYYFSNSEGIINNGRPNELVLLKVNSDQMSVKNDSIGSTSTQLIYRLPCICEIQITNKNFLLYNGYFNLYQFGKIKALPDKTALLK